MIISFQNIKISQMLPLKYIELFVSLTIVRYVNADTPANCTFQDIAGSWLFFVGVGGHHNTINCTISGKSLSN